MTKVFVERGEASYEKMFLENGWDVVKDLNDCDVVCFTGGADINPSMYHHKQHHTTLYKTGRDKDTLILWEDALKKDKKLVGICRGAQFLNVINGGTMYQHIGTSNHNGTHTIQTKEFGECFVSSDHHQMMNPFLIEEGGNAELVGWSDNLSSCIGYDPLTEEFIEVVVDKGIEVVYFTDTGDLSFQFHPEYFKKDHECQKLFFQILEAKGFGVANT